MKPKIPFLIFVLFMSLSISSSAEWISAGAVWDEYGIGNLNDGWAGTVQVQTPLDYILESNPGTQATIQTPNFFEIARSGPFKQGSLVVYPGDYVWLAAEIFDPQLGRYDIATSSIYVHISGAIQ